VHRVAGGNAFKGVVEWMSLRDGIASTVGVVAMCDAFVKFCSISVR
jgi:hypothetical protein